MATVHVLEWDAVPGAKGYLVSVRPLEAEKSWVQYTTDAPRVTLTGLAANREHKVQIQALCSPEAKGKAVANGFATPDVARAPSPSIYDIALNEGNFMDAGGHMFPYTPGEEYAVQITAPNGKAVELTFSEFDVASTDTLFIYEGTENTPKLLAELTGRRLPKSIVAARGELLCYFRSTRNSTCGKGWRATWTSLSRETTPPPTSAASTTGIAATPGGSGGSPAAAPSTPPLGPLPSKVQFSESLPYPATAPATEPLLAATYAASADLAFKDTDPAGKGFLGRYYAIRPLGTLYPGVAHRGVYAAHFEANRAEGWQFHRGTWAVRDGKLTQTEQGLDNSIASLPLRQGSEGSYLYQLNFQLTGGFRIKRCGFHFFASSGTSEHRGNSYFALIRDTDTADVVELYKSVGDKFDRKFAKTVLLMPSNAPNDLKIIYTPSTGIIELYLNNGYVGEWTDKFPLREGAFVSLRSGGAVLAVDDVNVFRSRPADAAVRLGIGATGVQDVQVASAAPGAPAFEVLSIVQNQDAKWSRIAQRGAAVAFTGGGTPPAASGGGVAGPTTGRTDPAPPKQPTADAPHSETVQPGKAYTGTFDLAYGAQLGVEARFVLVADYDTDLRAWQANQSKGYFFDAFDTPDFEEIWTPVEGRWRSENGILRQTDPAAANANAYATVLQQTDGMYLYHYAARYEGDARFGLHLFCSDPDAENRGNSYLVFFREGRAPKPDQVEVYRCDNNKLSLKHEAGINIAPGTWYDIKVVLDPRSGRMAVYLDNVPVAQWKDDKTALFSGNAISLRASGNVAFDELRVYKQLPATGRLNVRVGSSMNDLVRFQPVGGKPNARVYTLTRSTTGIMSPVGASAHVVQPPKK